MSADLFPLPLTPFEYYYWCDDRPQYPTVFPIELVFSPGLDRGRFERSLELVVRRHPLLASLVAEDGHRGPCWIGGGHIEPIDWANGDTPSHRLNGAAARIDLRHSPGLKIWARKETEGTRLVLHFHHACCDAIAARQFIEELLITYARECNGREVTPLVPLDPHQLRHRGGFAVPPGSLWTVLRDWWIGAKIWGKFAMQSSAPLAGVGSRQADPFLNFTSHSLEPELNTQIRRKAVAAGCTVNDLLLCGLFLAVRTWNRGHGQPDGILRINMPVAVSQRDNPLMPAANSLTFAFLTHKSRECDTPKKLLDHVRLETAAIKRYKLGLYFIGGLGTFRNVPGLIPWFLQRPACRATVVLSNVGRMFAHTPLPRQEGRLVCGDAVLQSIGGVPPLRPLTRAAIVVLTYTGRTHLHLRCDPQCFDHESQEKFLAEFVAQLERLSRTA